MNLKQQFSKNWPHLLVLAVFFITTFIYFAPEYDGYALKQHDIEQFAGMSQEIQMYREKFDEEPLWTNSMFGGMPAVQISMLYHGNIFQKTINGFLGTVGVPSGIFLLHLIGFYILALCLGIRPIVAVFGSFAFAFASYEIVIIQAGHNSKAIAVALMAPVVGAFLMTYKRNWKLGVLLSALFMTYEIASNHLQVTYYLGMLLLGLGIYELVKAIRSKDLKSFGIKSGLLVAAYGLAAFINFGNIGLTQEYAEATIRGGNEVSITPDGQEDVEKTSGLDKSYITNWSYGIGESFTLISPYVKGSASVQLRDTPFAENVINSDRSQQEINDILNAPFILYWGEQSITSGPVYIGIVVFFIMILGLVYLDDKRKWVMFAVGVLALMLSWGKNYMGLTEFFIDNIPGYNKFRTVTIILVLIELIAPLIGLMFLSQLYNKREELMSNKKPFLYAGAGVFALLLMVKVVGLGDGYSSPRDEQQMERIPGMIMNQLRNMSPQQRAQNNIDLNNQQQVAQIIDQQMEVYEDQFLAFKSVREDIFASSMNRSMFILVVAFALVALFFYSKVKTEYIMFGLSALVLADLVPVALNYLSKKETDSGQFKYWIPAEEKKYPVKPSQADYQIMEMESQDPEVLKAIQEGEKQGESKALELDFVGKYRNQVKDVYKFSALNFATNYRVFDYNNPWGSSRTSYFHKNLGGYHGAKLQNIQNVFDFHIVNGNNKVFDILNVKYFINGDRAMPNPNALGACWLAKNVETVETVNDELLALGNVYELQNVGAGQLLINGTSSKSSTLFGAMKAQYALAGDTSDINVNINIGEGMEAYFVVDQNGRKDFIPKQMIDGDSTASFTKLALLKVKSSFEPKEEVIVLKENADGLKKEYSAKGTLALTEYLPNKMTYVSSSDEEQLAVFSEIFYQNGWSATINGKEADILKVNYLLRGLKLPKGDNTIEFTFDLPKLKTANTLSVIGTILMLLAFGFYGYQVYSEKKKAA